MGNRAVAKGKHRGRPEIQRGPKGGRKHKPGKDHRPKSEKAAKKKFQKKAERKRKMKRADLVKQWEVWDKLPPDARKLLKNLEPSEPRPINEA
jgi:hypothetical protein